MKTSKNLYFTLNVDTKTKLDAIKFLGFDEFFTGINDKDETLSFEEQMEYAQKIDLPCTMVHCSYVAPDLDSIWLPEEHGDKVIDDYIRQINRCGIYTKNFVVHLHGTKNGIISQIGLERIKKLLLTCEKYNLNLCVENLYSDKEIDYIFSNISHPLLKICYDSGHKNCLTPNLALCEKYNKYITALHLHENNGESDEHKHISTNSIVFKRLTKEINILNHDIVLSSEAKCKNESWKEHLQGDLSALKELGKFQK